MQAERNGMPIGNGGGGGGGQRGGYGMPQRMAASPPKNKNTQHVPCKFYLQGQCQAGPMCPFSHDIESTTRPAPCKYFAKGGCKFGRKCMLLHVTPDGTVVNQRFPPPQYLAGPPPPHAFGPPPPGLLSLQAQNLEQRPNGDVPSDFEHYRYGAQNGYEMPQPDMTYTSASPKFGSPPANERIATSPPQKGLSVLDAPLPNSFDSNGISWAAIHGPSGALAASVPSRFGVESPPSSLPRKSQLGNSALRELHNSAYGGMDNVIASMGSSPPSGSDEPLSFAKRPLHSNRLRASRGGGVAASYGGFAPTPFEEWEEDDDGHSDREEELLPSSLHDLIPEDRPRRVSRNVEDSSSFLGMRRTPSGHGTPSESKVGSPHSSSPSRYNSVFARTAMQNGLGHVGSPLRDSSFPTSHPAGMPANGELSPSFSSPGRHTQASMSMLTQGLARTKLEAARSASSVPQVPVPTKTLSNGSTSARASMDRNLSSNSISQRIDEEQELFDMDIGSESKNGTSTNFGAIGGGRTGALK
ncbi:Putative Zinc finger, CCCH-type [Septoria linicola]|uniref:Zinc finger, CCCH-type n=1 Tax=Septoria linicola TaxID=215465 RepID=A0A9Q9AV57_9PEZI|nr:putative Zinc finger, CCCH-type [Septoria linicola]USW56467.1 Putative Zinc finger, CCCH-type [Septoria linicola]